MMKYGLEIINIGAYSDARLLAELAQQAEAAGWDGFFISDILHDGAEENPGPVSDPWIALAAIATRTERIKLGPQVTAPSRRRPWKLARETVTLDHLSNGRLIMGVGTGFEGDKGFAAFGEEMDAKKRAGMLDESLTILQGLWRGKPFRFNGEYYHVDEITFLPPPVQQSGIPIWVGGRWPNKKPAQRAARFDGANFAAIRNGEIVAPTPEETHQLKLLIDGLRADNTSPFDIVASGVDLFGAQRDGQATLKAYIEAGATWGLQRIWPQQDVADVRAAILQGPPSLQ